MCNDDDDDTVVKDSNGNKRSILPTITVVFKDVANVPDYKFDWPMFFITLGAFIIIYEGIMLIYGYLMRKIPLKQIMDE